MALSGSDITITQIQGFGESQIQSLTPEQISEFSTTKLSYITNEQRSWLNQEQIRAIDPSKLNNEFITSLNKENIQNLSPEQISQLSTDQLKAFTNTQSNYFNQEQIRAIDPSKINNFEFRNNLVEQPFTPEQIEMMSDEQIKQLQSQYNNMPKSHQKSLNNNALDVNNTPAANTPSANDSSILGMESSSVGLVVGCVVALTVLAVIYNLSKGKTIKNMSTKDDKNLTDNQGSSLTI